MSEWRLGGTRTTRRPTRWACRTRPLRSGEPRLTATQSLWTIPTAAVREHVFCRPPSTVEAERLRLERCSRLLPHDQDTGGFFVAVRGLNKHGL